MEDFCYYQTMDNDFVNLNDFNIKGINYYWLNRDKFNISINELNSLGIEGNFAYIKKEVVPNIESVNSDLEKFGFGVIVKDGYRSPELYKLVKQKRYELDGKENTDRTLNTDSMPHASGYTVDVNLYELETGEELELWDKDDWPDGIFTNYYSEKNDPKSKKYQELQNLLIETMLRNNFELGSMSEIWHFELVESSKLVH
jgi:D-alanyl-D-alanine dipeptidase